MSLSVYRKKRNFGNTPEPTESVKSRSKAFQFVVQRHDASHLHYDFRLEMDGVLKSWAIPKGPSMIAGEKRLAVMVEDHPISYGKFFGEIPEGNYGAGMVQIFDKGTYKPMNPTGKMSEEKQLLAALEKGDLKIVLKGKHLKGAFALVRMGSDNKNWLLIKKDDEFDLDKFNIEKISPLKSKKSIPLKKKSAMRRSPMKPERRRTVTSKRNGIR